MTERPDNFLARWSTAAASERANAQLFLTELADLLSVPRPGNDHAGGYSFEFPVKIPIGPGGSTDGRIDLYRRGCFVLEAKQFRRSQFRANRSPARRPRFRRRSRGQKEIRPHPRE